MIVDELKAIVSQSRSVKNREYIRNLLKEVIQLYVLNFIYTSFSYKNLIFTGGTCLRRLYNLPRLSEDLDFDTEGKSFPFEKFEKDIEDYFARDWQYKKLEIKFKEKKKTFFLRLPILRDIGFSITSETDFLFVRLDFALNQSRIFGTQKHLLSSQNFSFLVKAYDFPSLFANKINAFLTREFKKGREQKESFKGRDVFDLVWMLQKGRELSIKPNYNRLFDLTGVKDKDKLINLVNQKAEKIEPGALYEDLRGFFADLNFVEDFCQNFRKLVVDNIDYLR